MALKAQGRKLRKRYSSPKEENIRNGMTMSDPRDTENRMQPHIRV